MNVKISYGRITCGAYCKHLGVPHQSTSLIIHKVHIMQSVVIMQHSLVVLIGCAIPTVVTRCHKAWLVY